MYLRYKYVPVMAQMAQDCIAVLVIFSSCRCGSGFLTERKKNLVWKYRFIDEIFTHTVLVRMYSTFLYLVESFRVIGVGKYRYCQ